MRSAAVARHMGWENSASMWGECAYDYNAVWKEEAREFVPVVGLLPALASKGSGARPHVLKQRPEKVLVKRAFPVSANQVLRKGKTASSSSLKTVSRWEVKSTKLATVPPRLQNAAPSASSSSVPAWAGKLRF